MTPGSSPSDHDSEASVGWGIDSITGLPEFPPLTYEDGRTRYRICKKCRERKPLRSYRRHPRRTPLGDIEAGVYRRRKCRNCEQREQAKRDRIKRGLSLLASFDHACEQIRHVRTADQILGLVERIAEELPSKDLEGLAIYWASVITSPKTSHRLRLSSLQTLAHIAAVADQARLAEDTAFESVNPADFAAFLHTRGLLAPLIRACLSDGLLTLDDIDPPPA